MNENNLFPDRLKELREEQKLTQGDMGVGIAILVRWKKESSDTRNSEKC